MGKSRIKSPVTKGVAKVPVILQDSKIEEKAKMIDGNIYFPLDTVKELFTARFYHDYNENLLLYTNAETTIRTEIGRRYNCYADISTGRGFTFTDKAKNKKDARVLLQIEVEGRKRKNQYDDFRQGQRESKELKDSLLMRYAYDKFLKHVPDNKRPNESYCKQNFESFLTKAKERGYKLNYILQNVDSLVELLRTDKNNMSRSKKECCKKDEYGFI